MTTSFEDYCEDYLDLQTALMNEEEIKSARKGYADFISTEKTPKEIKKHKQALEKAKESRKLAKFYGGKALTGSATQKKWAEEIRQNILESSSLSEEQKTRIVAFSLAQSAKFWIDNRDKKAELFNVDVIIAEHAHLCELYKKHYDTLARTNFVCNKELARKEIYEALSSLTIAFRFNFPDCNFYDNYGVLIKGLKFRC